MIDRHLFVIFGGSGDLTRRKLLPQLYRLITENQFEDRCIVLGVATGEGDDDSYRRWAHDALAEAGLEGEQSANWCDTCVHYQPISSDSNSYRVLNKRIEELERELGLPGNRVFYLALPPTVFPIAIAELGDAGLNRSRGWTRLVIEKPFGRDLVSARELNRVAHRHFDESQVYRIDHYLGKETVQNLLAFRFANPLFETAWNRDRVESVDFTVAESIGLEGRAGYYEQAGALRDMVQNHLTQVLALVAMEAPTPLQAEAIRDEKVKLLRSIAPIDLDQVLFGQYTEGTIDDQAVAGYRQEAGVDSQSSTPTFVSLQLEIDNWRWQGVPFRLRAGKRLPQRLTQIVVTFRRSPACLFHGLRDDGCEIHSNMLTITLQPNEGFSLHFDVKSPGEPFRLESRPLHFQYDEAFGPLTLAYQTLIHDIIEGDQTLFVRADEVEESWKIYTPVLEQPPATQMYPAGSWGPGPRLSESTR